MARASTLRGWRGREQLRELRLRRLQRDVRDIKRRLWTLEVRAMIDDCDAPPLELLPEAVVVPERVLKEAKPRIKSGVTEEQDSPPALPLSAAAVEQPAAVESGAPCAPSPAADEIDLVPPPGSDSRSVEDGPRGAARPMPRPPEPAPQPIALRDAEPGNVGTSGDGPRGGGRSAVTSGKAGAGRSTEAPAPRDEPERYGEIRKRKPRPDWQRMAEALKRRNAAVPAAAPVRTKALPVAFDKGPCPRCGIPGFRGCDHQLPYDEARL